MVTFGRCIFRRPERNKYNNIQQNNTLWRLRENNNIIIIYRNVGILSCDAVWDLGRRHTRVIFFYFLFFFPSHRRATLNRTRFYRSRIYERNIMNGTLRANFAVDPGANENTKYDNKRLFFFSTDTDRIVEKFLTRHDVNITQYNIINTARLFFFSSFAGPTDTI